MIYKSNLEAPDLTQYFSLKLAVRDWSLGHTIPSHPAIDPDCGYWSHDEAAIMYNVAQQVGGLWVDIGSRFGWSSAHLLAAGCSVVGVDPEYHREDFTGAMRAGIDNMRTRMIGRSPVFYPCPMTSASFFERSPADYDGFVIDGNHDSPEPLKDAIGALAHAKPDCAVMFHDFYGRPIRDGVRYLIEQGWKCRVYWTPAGVALCWRGFTNPAIEMVRGRCGFVAPPHTGDPAILDAMRDQGRFPEFDLARWS